MMDRQHGKVLFVCDSCDEVYDADTDDFDLAWASAKRDGWRARKLGEEWLHTCPSCGAPT